ncbi:MAG: hypothetical protein J6T23_05995 [Elusimicrobia bacterium]|nr:hypothetical protein [Elusimicrobiota bacterium]
MWQSVNPVHFADGSIDYLGIIAYHDNDIQNGTYSTVGTIKRQGEIFNRTGTGGNVSGDHIHLEVGKGQVNLQSDYLYHFRDDTGCKRIKPDEALFINDTTIIPDYNNYYQGYHFIEYDGGITPPTPPDPPTPTPSDNKNFWKKWFLMRNKKIIIRY